MPLVCSRSSDLVMSMYNIMSTWHTTENAWYCLTFSHTHWKRPSTRGHYHQWRSLETWGSSGWSLQCNLLLPHPSSPVSSSKWSHGHHMGKTGHLSLQWVCRHMSSGVYHLTILCLRWVGTARTEKIVRWPHNAHLGTSCLIMPWMFTEVWYTIPLYFSVFDCAKLLPASVSTLEWCKSHAYTSFPS